MSPSTAGVDARRYTWCWSQAVWSFGAVLPMLAEDVDGAEADEQPGLLEYVCRLVGEYCAVAVHLVTAHPRPLPPTAVRAVTAVASVPDARLREVLTDLLYGTPAETDQLAPLAREAVRRTQDILGPVPVLIGEHDRVRALAQARDWVRLIELVGEGGGDYLPDVEGRRPASGA
ncbi:hypothetical protein FM076_30355 [Streptomyces albus subsp. chlorinus]|uniref:hypothetical protein n=1 Tax=Streptomyces albus TaxID=1888 RepID=UPI001570935C|nr:hypothetical protein [Streptomyces albus]NSC25221.1 hypothetical protein [Streptomyces albus subsp. chlorinus]